MRNDNPYFAKTEPTRIRELLDYFRSYCDKYSSISLFEITSFFKGAVVYILLPIISLLLLCMYPHSFSIHLLGIFIVWLGSIIIRNSQMPIPDRIKRIYVSPQVVTKSISVIQKIAESVQLHNVRELSDKTFLQMYKLGGCITCIVGLTLVLHGRHLTISAISLCLISFGVITEQMRFFAGGVLFALFLILL